MNRLLRVWLLAGVIGWGGICAAEDAKADKDADAAAATDEINDNTTVYVVGKTKIFHLEDCKEVKKAEKTGKDTKEFSMEEAKKQKYRPCPLCVNKALKKQEKKAKEEAKSAKKHKKEEKEEEKTEAAAD